MGDDGLRALERRHRDTGAVDDHARWIAARVRAGELSEHRARLAADLGHVAARLAVGGPTVTTLGAVIGTIDAVCRATRQPSANAEARWVLTGEAPTTPAFMEEALDFDALNTRIATAAAGAARGVLAHDDEWLGLMETWREQHEDVLWNPTLSRQEMLAALLPASRATAAGLLDGLEDAWRRDAAEVDPEGAAGDWPGIDLWFCYMLNMSTIDTERDDDVAALLREVIRCPRGAVMLACCAAMNADTASGTAAVGAVKGAVAAAGESAVRAAIVRLIGPWLLREEP